MKTMHCSKQPTILFYNINGAGMGHLSRCLSYARRLRNRANVTFFSLASALEYIEAMGFSADYFVSPFWSDNTARTWNVELALRLGMLLERVRPDIVVFDGTWPFQGFLAACQAYGKTCLKPKLVWSNGGLYREDTKQVSVDESHFDLLLQPGELWGSPSETPLPGGGKKMVLSPFTLLDDHELLCKAKARAALHLNQEGRMALLALGAGNLNNVHAIAHNLMRALQPEQFTIVWACVPISVQDMVLPPMVTPITVYPLLRYIKAFDVVVSAAGYSTCYEVMQAQIPTLLLPNVLSKDDQLRRAHLISRHAPVVVSSCDSEEEVISAVRRLLDLVDAQAPLPPPPLMNGARLAAETILKLAEQARSA